MIPASAIFKYKPAANTYPSTGHTESNLSPRQRVLIGFMYHHNSVGLLDITIKDGNVEQTKSHIWRQPYNWQSFLPAALWCFVDFTSLRAHSAPYWDFISFFIFILNCDRFSEAVLVEL